jgi:hypothetical protein
VESQRKNRHYFDSFLKTISTIKENLRTWIRLVYCKDISGYARRNNKNGKWWVKVQAV